MLYHSSLSTKILFVLFVNAKWEDTSYELQVHHIFKGGENQAYFFGMYFRNPQWVFCSENAEYWSAALRGAALRSGAPRPGAQPERRSSN